MRGSARAFYRGVRGRLTDAVLGGCIAVPVQALELWMFFRIAPPHAEEPIGALVIANLVVLGLLCTGAADYALVRREGRALLVGCGVALLIPGAMALDQVVAMSTADWDLGTWVAVALPYLILLLALSAAEAGLYLLATRPTVAR